MTPGASEEPPAFVRLWRRFERLDRAGQSEAVSEWTGRAGDLLTALEGRLASPEARDRCKALRIARLLGVGEPLGEHVYSLANDADATVRSAAAALLGEVSGATARRILDRLLGDPDPRVQANAVEAVDRAARPRRDVQIIPKLESRHHRVRAAAVAALLKMKVERAGEVLLDMLEDRARSQRIAALWVVERLHLGSLLHRLDTLAEDDPDLQVRRRALRVRRSITGGAMPFKPASTREVELP